MNIYLVGSLREGRVRDVAHILREDGHNVFDDWQACHPDADAHWRNYEIERGRTWREALSGAFAKNVLSFDRSHLFHSDTVILIAKPKQIAGFDAACELTWAKQWGKNTFILLDGEPERWSCMAPLAVDPWDIHVDIDELRAALQILTP